MYDKIHGKELNNESRGYFFNSRDNANMWSLVNKRVVLVV